MKPLKRLLARIRNLVSHQSAFPHLLVSNTEYRRIPFGKHSGAD
jgi:hypothetical protein